MINYFGKSNKVSLDELYNIINSTKDGFYHSGVDTTLRSSLVHTDKTYYYIASELVTENKDKPIFDFLEKSRELSYIKKVDLPKIQDYYPDIKAMLPTSYEVWRDLKKIVLLNREIFKDYIKLPRFNNIEESTVLKYLRMYADMMYHPTIKHSYLVNILDRVDINSNDIFFKSRSDMYIKQYRDIDEFREVFNRYVYFYIILKYYNEPHLVNSMQPDLNKSIEDRSITYSYKFNIDIKRNNINKSFYKPFIEGAKRSSDITQADYNRYYRDIKFTKNIKDILISMDNYVSSNPYPEEYILENPKGNKSFVNKYKNSLHFKGKSVHNLSTGFYGAVNEMFKHKYDIYAEKHGGGLMDISYYYDCYERAGDDGNLDYCKFLPPMVTGYVNSIFSMYEIKNVSLNDDVISVNSTPLRKSTISENLYSDKRMKKWDESLNNGAIIPIGSGHNGIIYKPTFIDLEKEVYNNAKFKYLLDEPQLFHVLDFGKNFTDMKIPNISRVDLGLSLVSDNKVYRDESVEKKDSITSNNTHIHRAKTPTPEDVKNKMYYYLLYPQSNMPSYLYQPYVPQDLYNDIDVYDPTRKYDMSRYKDAIYEEDARIYRSLRESRLIGGTDSTTDAAPWFPSVVTSRANTNIPMYEYHPTVVMRLYWGYGQDTTWDTWGYRSWVANERREHNNKVSRNPDNLENFFDDKDPEGRPYTYFFNKIPSRSKGHFFEMEYDIERYIDSMEMAKRYYFDIKEMGISNFNIITPEKMLEKHKYTSTRFGQIKMFEDRDFNDKWLILFNGAIKNTDIKDYGAIYHNTSAGNQGLGGELDGFGFVQYMNVFCLNIPEINSKLKEDIKALSREYQEYRMEHWLPKANKDAYRSALEDVIRKNTTTKNKNYIIIGNEDVNKYELSDIDLSTGDDLISKMVSNGKIINKDGNKILIYKINKKSNDANDIRVINTIKNNRLNVVNPNLNNLETWVDRFSEIKNSMQNPNNRVYTNDFSNKVLYAKIFKNNLNNNISLINSDNNLYLRYGSKSVRLHKSDDKPSDKKGLMTNDSINTIILNLSKSTTLDILRDYGLLFNDESIIDNKTVSKDLFNTKLSNSDNINTNNDIDVKKLSTNDISDVKTIDDTSIIKTNNDTLYIGDGELPIYINSNHIKSLITINGNARETTHDYINDKSDTWYDTIPTFDFIKFNDISSDDYNTASTSDKIKLDKNKEVNDIYKKYLYNKDIRTFGHRLTDDKGKSINKIVWLGDINIGSFNYMNKISEEGINPRDNYSYIYNDRLYRRLNNNELISDNNINPLFVRSQAYTLDELGIRSNYKELKIELLINGDTVDTIYMTKDQIESDSNRYSYYFNKNINYGNDKILAFGIDLVKTSINRNGFLNTVVYYSFVKNKNKDNLIYDIKLYWR